MPDLRQVLEPRQVPRALMTYVGPTSSSSSSSSSGSSGQRQRRRAAAAAAAAADAAATIAQLEAAVQARRRLFKTPRPQAPRDDTIRYRASKRDCDICPLKATCCPNEPARKVTRSIHEAARDHARTIAQTEAYLVSRREREEGGDAVRPPQTHPQARPIAAARPLRRPRRVPPRAATRPEPPPNWPS